ncbi:MAG: oxygen-independent coproporphyrinogen III oxidase [Burkholderiaceae bacterium]|jgi:oxygen-independent coproporphyrinogen-3 oxidase|nr:oxygen-independent coproporphyrinogen III oxidase [Burkholderiales bacterium]MCE2643642.1 oxygen-independent coproporphyrinogen III oxidase [Burkholderiaceae bacterium]
MSTRGEVAVPDPALLHRFDVPGPRYTSYPTADRFVEAFDAQVLSNWLGKRADATAPLSLYVHLPFCATVCYYCACNKVITKDHSRGRDYLTALRKEADLIASRLTGSRQIEQLHFGGGTPTFLSNDELRELMALLTERFPMAPKGEYSIEVDPRSTPPDKVAVLGELGFNRISVGVQDFDPQVQKAVNRIQSFEMTQATIEAARKADFKSVNLDLIYGLPKQSRATFARTLDKVLVLSPERVALYHYAHLPERFKPQRRIDAADLPSPQEKMGIMLDAIGRLTQAGYQYIGMDHFAKGADDLARAQQQGRLHRNFQGYSTRPDCDLIGLGVSAISKIGPTYSQNVRELDEYYDRLKQDQLPTARGVLLDMDDLVRRSVIMSLMCHFEVSKEAIEQAHLVKFDEYFRRELAELKPFEDEGLVENTREWISVLPRGKLLVRAIAMGFDRYIKNDERVRKYSKIV